MARKKKEAVVEEQTNELCPKCEKIILAAGRVDSVKDLIANRTYLEGGQAVLYAKEGHTIRRISTSREYVLKKNKYSPNNELAFATLDSEGNINAFWTLTTEELLADDWVLIK